MNLDQNTIKVLFLLLLVLYIVYLENKNQDIDKTLLIIAPYDNTLHKDKLDAYLDNIEKIMISNKMKKKVFIIEDGGINSHFKRGQLCNAGAVIGKDYDYFMFYDINMPLENYRIKYPRKPVCLADNKKEGVLLISKDDYYKIGGYSKGDNDISNIIQKVGNNVENNMNIEVLSHNKSSIRKNIEKVKVIYK